MVKLIFLFLFLPLTSQAVDVMSSRTAGSTHEIFLGAGEALGFPASIRYRYNDIEGGFINSGMLGVAKQFKNPYYPSLYSEIGLGLTPSSGSTGAVPGLFGAMGGSWKIWGILRFRCELNMVGGVTSYVKGGALVGISFAF